MTKFLFAFCLCGSLLFAQPPAQRARKAGPASFDALKSSLGLTDAQVDQLRQLQRERFEANRSVFEQIRSRHETLRNTLSPTADPAAVGRLMVEIEGLKAQVRQGGEANQAKALNVLTPEQRGKLKTLEEAAKLAPAMRQAAALGLLEPPEGGFLGAGPHFRKFRHHAPGMGMGPGGTMRERRGPPEVR